MAAELPPGVTERFVDVNGIKMHIVEKGGDICGAPVLLFLHGFPECWYSWRHQIVFLGDSYHCVAPDLRGYGQTTSPLEKKTYTCFDLVKDLTDLMDVLGVQDVFLVGHDWGAILGWYLCMFYPERVRGYVCLSVPFLRRDPEIPTVDWMHSYYWNNYYICRFQSPTMEKQMQDAGGPEYVLPNIFTLRKPGPPIFPKDNEYGTGFNPDMPETLPPWLTEKDLKYYISQFKEPLHKNGFTGALNYYRNFNENWHLTDPNYKDPKFPPVTLPIKLPVVFVVGELDITITSLGLGDYIKDGFKDDVPGLEDVIIQKGVAHFNNQEAAEDVTDIICAFVWNVINSNSEKK